MRWHGCVGKLAGASYRKMASTNTVMVNDPNQNQPGQQQPVVIRQGGNGIGLVLAALIVAGAAIYAVNVWSTTKKETAPGKTLQEGVERIKEGVGKAIEQRQQ